MMEVSDNYNASGFGGHSTVHRRGLRPNRGLQNDVDLDRDQDSAIGVTPSTKDLELCFTI